MSTIETKQEVKPVKSIKSMCTRDCYDSCFITAAVGDDGSLVSVTGDPDSPVTCGFTCPRGVMDVRRVYNSRVLYPHLRTTKKGTTECEETRTSAFNRIHWDEALNRIASQLDQTIAQYGAESVLVLDYAGNTGLLSSEFPHRLWNSLGASLTDGALCTASGQEGLRLHYGEGYGLPPEDLPDKDLIVFWGFNAPVSSSHTWAKALEARKKNNSKIIVIDPRISEAAKSSDFHIRPYPGSDLFLAFGVCRILIETGGVDMDFIRNETLGYDELKEKILSYDPERITSETGLSWQTVEFLADAYRNSRQSATMMGIGIQKAVNGADMIRGISFIPALRGLHRGFFYSNSSAALIDTDYIRGNHLIASPLNTVSMVELGEYVRRNTFKFIFIYGMNPALTLPGQAAFREGLSNSECFVVVHDTHWTATSDFADVVLPAASFFEKPDICLTWVNRQIRLSPQIIEPLGESRTEVWLMHELARRITANGANNPNIFDDPWKVLEKAFEGALENGSFSQLMQGENLKLKFKPFNFYKTSSGKIEFFSFRAVEKGYSPLPGMCSEKPGVNEFILLNSASRNYTNTQFIETYGPIPAIVKIHPDDASRLGIDSGDRVTLSNNLGCIEAAAEISDSVQPGVLWIPRQSTGLNGIPMNTLAAGRAQQVGAGPTFNSLFVSLAKTAASQIKLSENI